MKPCVVDASVVAAAFFQETHAEAASALLTSGRGLLAPDLIYPETTNVIWKRYGRREISENEAEQLVADITSLPLRITPSNELIDSALKLAIQTRRTAYDCLYLALAVETGTIMFTSDRRMANALANTPLERHITWIGHSR